MSDASNAQGATQVSIDHRRPTLQDEVVRYILSESLSPGDPLPTETDLMTTFAASRNSVREALRALQALGIVDIRHGYGTFVGQASLDILHTSIVFRAGLAGEQLRIMSNLIDLREVLESGFIDVVIDRISPADLDQLDAVVARMDDPAQLSAADREFHELLYRSCNNQLLLELIGAFWNVYQTVEKMIEEPDVSTSSISEVHGAIVDQVRARDIPRAREAVHDHFHDVRKRIAAISLEED